MLILLGLSIVPVVIKMFMGDVEKDKNKKKKFLILCGIIIALITGLRHYSVGSRDTENYRSLFLGATRYSSLVDFFNVHKLFENGFFLSESLFYLFVWCFAKVTSEPQLFILVVSAFITFSVMRFIYKHSENALLSVIMYVCLGILTFNLNGMRQAIAMAICLFAYGYAKDKKLIPFIVTILLAMLVHKTAILFAIVYIISYLKFDVKSVVMFLIAIVLFVLFADNLVAAFDSVADKNYAESESFESGGYVTVLIYVLIIGLTLLISGKQLSEKSVVFALYITVLGGVLYLARYFSTQIYERMSYYFFYANILLLPRTLNRIDEAERPIMVAIIIVLLIALFAYRLYGSAFHNFMFFWG